MKKTLPFSLLLIILLGAAHTLSAQCNLPFQPGTGPQGCQNAPVFCSTSDLDGYCSSTGATGSGVCPGPFCATCENSHWFSFYAGSTVLSLLITPSNCSGGGGLQAQIFATSDCNNFTPVSNCESPGFATPMPVTATNLSIGQVYYLLIDGYQADMCDYTIEVASGSVDAPSAVIPGTISGTTAVCPGASINYSVPGGTGISNYDWSLTPTIGAISNDGNNTITIDYTSPGTAQLCVTPSNTCETGPTICETVISTPIPPQFNYVTFCFGESWTCEGETFFTPGQHQFVYDSWLGCDSIITCIGTAIPPTIMPPEYAAICQGEGYGWCGNEYALPGTYTLNLTGANGCDSIVTLVLSVLDQEAVIAPPDTLDCSGNDTLALDGTGSTTIPVPANSSLSYSWTGPGIVSGGNTLTPTIDQPGVYTLTVTHSYLGADCIAQDSVTVWTDPAPDPPVMEGPEAACFGTTSSYTIAAAGSGPFPTGFTWSVTGGTFIVSGETIEVTWDTAGQGEVCVTADNECGASTQTCLTVEIQEKPMIMPPLEAAICKWNSYPFAGNTYDSTGIYEVNLESFYGCDSVVTLDLTVLEALAVIAPPGTLDCNGALMLDGSGSTLIPAASGAVLSYSWMGPSIVSGGNTLTPSVSAPGIYCLTVTQEYLGVECSDQECVVVIQNSEEPNPPSVSGPISACTGSTAAYTATPASTGPDPTWFIWSVTGGVFTNNGDSIIVSWTTASTGEVCVVAKNACGNSPPVCMSVEILESVVMPPVEAAICQGESFSFVGNDYDETGVYPVNLTAANGCDSLVTLDLTALEAEAVIAPPDTLNCFGNTIILLDGTGSTSTPSAPGAVIAYSWTGPGVVSGIDTPTPEVNAPGDYCLTVTQSYLGVECSDSKCVSVTEATFIVDPEIVGPSSICTGMTAGYFVFTGSIPPINEFNWIVTGGSFTSYADTIEVYWLGAGQEEVCVFISNICGLYSMPCITVEVLETPLAQFDYIQDGAQFSFTGGSSGATDWTWDFGDGNTSSEQNPIHTYTVDGTYEVSLIAGNGLCTDTISQSIQIVGVSNREIKGMKTFSLAPSISSGQFMLTIDLERPADLELSVVNALGQTVRQFSRPKSMNLKETIDLSGMAPGGYLVWLKMEGDNAVRKIVVMK